MGVILFAGWYSPELCSQHPTKVFVFGDNLTRTGKGGQAVIRDEPNAIGVATKRRPSMTPGSFFAKGSPEDTGAVLRDLGRIWALLNNGGCDVVIPASETWLPSLGLERAQLQVRAPDIYDMICRHMADMGTAFGETRVARSL